MRRYKARPTTAGKVNIMPPNEYMIFATLTPAEAKWLAGQLVEAADVALEMRRQDAMDAEDAA